MNRRGTEDAEGRRLKVESEKLKEKKKDTEKDIHE
jgi:hypothetical protein